jgi:voltage-gated potassium channel
MEPHTGYSQARLDQSSILRTRLVVATLWLMVVVAAGAAGFHTIGAGRWPWIDCVYFTIITLSTVGYGETLPGFEDSEYSRLWTVMLIVLGSGTLLYFISTLTAFIVEGDLGGALRRNRMKQALARLEGHTIVCGAGTTGIHVIEELVHTHTRFCVIDVNEMRLVELAERFGEGKFLFVVGDAADDEVLQAAGIERARCVVAALHEDKDNLFVTVTASALNPKIRIVAKAVEVSARAKLLRAGAKSVVSPTQIGGMRLASEAIRPMVTEFLDLMLRDPKKNLRIEEVTIPAKSSLVGTQLKDTNIRQATKAMVIAIRGTDGSYEYNPEPTFRLGQASTLIVLAETVEMKKLRDGIDSGKIGKTS